ncbi:MAG: hypothetical protein CBHOC_2381 [uncultured Caballeronia sp.]|nr:MAG: hypothetical protein CBHOC_2381 [uncultured Caballeronia sp.]
MKVALVGAGLIGQSIAHLLRETGISRSSRLIVTKTRSRSSMRRASRRAASISRIRPRCVRH